MRVVDSVMLCEARRGKDECEEEGEGKGEKEEEGGKPEGVACAAQHGGLLSEHHLCVVKSFLVQRVEQYC